jgi:hypothetical protein
MTTEEWASCVQIMNVTLGGEMPFPQLEGYFRLLKHFPGLDVKKAVARILRENEHLHAKRYPSIAEITKAAQACQGVLATPEDAYDRARAAVKRYGLDQSAKAREMCGETLWTIMNMSGGYERFCDCSPDERSALFAQFRNAWIGNAQATMDRVAGDGRGPKVLGLPDVQEVQKTIQERTVLALENLANNVTLSPHSEDAEPVGRPAPQFKIEPGFPVNPKPGDDLSRGYYVLTANGPRFVSPEEIHSQEASRALQIQALTGAQA